MEVAETAGIAGTSGSFGGIAVGSTAGPELGGRAKDSDGSANLVGGGRAENADGGASPVGSGKAGDADT